MKQFKKALLTNLCLMVIIGFVYIAAFGPLARFSDGPALKGCTGQENVALQITVTDGSDVGAYMDTLERMGAHGTFFFCEQCGTDTASIDAVRARGHGVGFYVCAAHSGQETDMYIGGGYTVPVMHYAEGGSMRRIGPSIDIARLKSLEGWQQMLSDKLFGDMFLRVVADNQLGDFEKVVQIVSKKGYTILKVDEML